jgi:tRNA threonylcarbamoyladenosine biosynthesis protein TsaE
LKTFVSKSEDDTLRIAAEIAAECRPGAVYALKGDLGAGKTVFSRGFARALGVTEPICSPTFTIVQEYAVDEKRFPDITRLHHMDVYRISDSEAALAFGVDDYLNDDSAVNLIEWPERVAEILPPETVSVEIRHMDENSRKIVVE